MKPVRQQVNAAAASKRAVKRMDRTRTGELAKKYTPKFLWAILRAIFLVGMCFVIVYPLLYMISIAIRPTSEMFDPSIVWIPKSLTLENLKIAVEKMGFTKGLLDNNTLVNTISLNFVSSLLQVFTACLTGYSFARFQFRFRGLLFALVIFTMVVPINSIILPTYLMYRNFNLIDNYLSFYIPAFFGMGIKSGLCIFIFRQFFKGMPQELEDAAAIDGCGALRTYFQVFIPNATPGLLTAFIFSVVWYWNDYYYTYMFFPQKQTISIALSGLKSILNSTSSLERDPYAMMSAMQAGCLISIVPLLLFYILLQKQFTESIDRTGIVG